MSPKTPGAGSLPFGKYTAEPAPGRQGGGMPPISAMIARPELDVTAERAPGHYTHEKPRLPPAPP